MPMKIEMIRPLFVLSNKTPLNERCYCEIRESEFRYVLMV